MKPEGESFGHSYHVLHHHQEMELTLGSKGMVDRL